MYSFLARNRWISLSRCNSRRAKRFLTLSSVQGPLHPPLDARTLPQYFQSEILPNHSTRPALICRKELPRAHHGPPSKNIGVATHLAWDFEELDRHSNALARGLLNMGVRKGDRVAVVMGNNSAYAMLQWACANIGAILVTLNPAYRSRELVETLNLVGVKHLFIVPRIRTSSYVEMLTEVLPELRSCPPGNIQAAAAPELRNLVVVDNTGILQREGLNVSGTIDWREIIMWQDHTQEEKSRREIIQSLNKDDVINLQFTSGTTGSPKAVSLSHSNLINNALSMGRSMRISEKDILCNAPPLFHSFDKCSVYGMICIRLILVRTRLIVGNLAFWSHGACVVYASENFDPESVVDAVVSEKCTALHGVPTHFLGVLAEVDKRQARGESLDMSNLRTGIAGASSVPIGLMKSLVTKLNLTELTLGYGMTETSPISFQTTPGDSFIKRTETSGKVQPHLKAKIIDSDGNIVPIGTPGEICVAGYALQKGYWEDDEHTKEVMKKDETGTLWIHTGDKGIIDEEGYLSVVGRIKDIIIRGGENLFPVQIENAILNNQGVREAAAVSVPDAIFGEVVGAWIVRQPGTNILRQDIWNTVLKSMNPQNAPTWVWFLGEDGTPDELPKTASGKIMKHVLRQWSRDLSQKMIGLVEKNGK